MLSFFFNLDKSTLWKAETFGKEGRREGRSDLVVVQRDPMEPFRPLLGIIQEDSDMP